MREMEGTWQLTKVLCKSWRCWREAHTRTTAFTRNPLLLCNLLDMHRYVYTSHVLVRQIEAKADPDGKAFSAACAFLRPIQ